MAILFVDSNGGAPSSPYANWTDAAADLKTALADGACVAGSTVYVAHNHNAVSATDATLSNSGTIVSSIVVECVNTITGLRVNTAAEDTSGTAHMLPFTGKIIYRGLNFKSSDTVSGLADSFVTLEDCTFEMKINTASDDFWFNVADQMVRFKNVTLKLANAGQQIGTSSGFRFSWDGGGLDGAGVGPDYLINPYSTGGSSIILKNLDLSSVATAIFKLSTSIATGLVSIEMTGCKIPAAVPIVDTVPLSVPHTVIVRSCDTGDTKEYFEEIYLEGQIVYATNCFRTGSSVEFSAKMTPNANAVEAKRPLVFKLSEFYSAANPTLAVEMIGTIILQNDKCWLRIEYPNETDEAKRDIDDSSRQEVGWSGGSGPGTPANLTTSTEAWTEDLTGEVKQKIEVAISGGAAGIHTVYICIAKDLSGADESVYVDSDVTVS